MKLINFYEVPELNALLDEMGADLNKLSSPEQWQGIDDNKLLELLNTGEVEVDFSEISTDGEVLEYKGRKVIVYIRDQYYKYYDRGYKFHLANCNTISKAIHNKRKSRYVVSLRTDGHFRINLLNEGSVVKQDLIEELNVCKNCLDKINYDAYRDGDWATKSNIYNTFSLKEYFDKYKASTLNENEYRDSVNAPLNVYNPDFDHTSKILKSIKKYTCEECGTNLANHTKYLHTHHKDGDKSNDASYNLEVLCIRCHANKPEHHWLKFNKDYNEFLKLLGHS